MTASNRLYWGNLNKKLPELDLTLVQRDSWAWFLKDGIRIALKEVATVDDFTGKNWTLEFLDFFVGEPEITPQHAILKSLSYTAPLRVLVRLTNKRTNTEKEQKVFLGDMPLMTRRGTFIINGVERGVVSQIVRSPGVYFSEEFDPASGRRLAKAELRPIRGSWLEFEASKNGILYARVDRRRKFPVTTFLRAVGFSTNEEIRGAFDDLRDYPTYSMIEASLAKDPTHNKDEALIEIYKRFHPGEPAVLENAETLVKNMFFNPRRYDLSEVGRYKINKRLKVPDEKTTTILTPDDILQTVKYVLKLQNGEGRVDDIDHLANRRIRRVGELVASTAFRVGLLRLERAVQEKMSLADPEEDAIAPINLINARPVIAAINEFFRSNQLSTIVDQTNPLSEIDNLRRLSVMGPGGISRERASFSIRDINSSQYGRLCPVRSPEGPNIGLVTYMSLFTRINEFGFMEAPYFKVEKIEKDGEVKMRVTDELVYMSADDEEELRITHADLDISEDGTINETWVPMRYQGNFSEGSVEQVDYIDIIPRQVVGSAASLIPFLANDDSIRALMGTHMQCQAVPLVRASAPVVGTGMESEIARAMNWAVRARHDGIVKYADADKIEVELINEPQEAVESEDYVTYAKGVETYHVIKFRRSSASTCYNQRVLVKVGDKVKKGDVIVDGPACDGGELSLGQNLLVAYASFDGLGYEDAIVISDRLVKEDLLTSIHIEEYSAAVVDTKLGAEELTRDIPGVSESELARLSDDGIITVGSEIGPGDILVGKIAPKGETELSAEERLLRAIFGEKAKEVRDTSLRMPHGDRGIVVDVRVLDREKGDELESGTLKEVIVLVAQMRKITAGDKLAGRHGNKGVISRIMPAADMPFLDDGTPVDIMISPISVLGRMNLGQLMEAQIGMAMAKQGKKVAVPVFESIPEERLQKAYEEAGLPVSGKVFLRDGRSGEKYETPTMVGVGYILKLIHMVEDKTHARSTGPYSLVTQQPLGGKAQMGGQRLGEMEVWALEAHRAAHTLQEMLTIKSDDIVGRSKAFEAIVKGTEIPESNVPESFKVLVKELQSLGINILAQGAKLVEEIPSDESVETQGEVSENENIDEVENEQPVEIAVEVENTNTDEVLEVDEPTDEMLAQLQEGLEESQAN